MPWKIRATLPVAVAAYEAISEFGQYCDMNDCIFCGISS